MKIVLPVSRGNLSTQFCWSQNKSGEGKMQEIKLKMYFEMQGIFQCFLFFSKL